MFRTFKTLLLWLLLAALPMQGIAAAAMMSCRTMQHAGELMHSGDGTEAHASMHAHHHGHHAHDAAATTGDDTSGDPQAGRHSHAKHDVSTSCSACAACCIGTAALPSGLDWPFVRNESQPVSVAPAPLVAGFIPAGLERPPRAISS